MDVSHTGQSGDVSAQKLADTGLSNRGECLVDVCFETSIKASEHQAILLWLITDRLEIESCRNPPRLYWRY